MDPSGAVEIDRLPLSKTPFLAARWTYDDLSPDSTEYHSLKTHFLAIRWIYNDLNLESSDVGGPPLNIRYGYKLRTE